MPPIPSINHLTITSFRSGLWASLAMVPFGLAFRAAGLRINEYGPRVVDWVLGPTPPPVRMGAFLALHFLIGVMAAVPFLALLPRLKRWVHPVVLGLAYGAGFYGVVNSWALPWVFGDLTPWALGPSVVLPSLIVHLVYEAVLGYVGRNLNA